MNSIKFTRAAFQAFHSQPFLVVVSDNLYNAARSSFPKPACLLVLTSLGQIHLPEEDASSGEATIAFMGVAAGLRLVVYGKKHQAAVDRLSEALENNNPNYPVHLALLNSQVGFLQRSKMNAVACRMFAQFLTQQKSISSQTEQGLVALRRKNDWLTLNLQKARQMIRGIGYDTKYLKVECPVGTKSIGPKGTIVADAFSQRLPCDVLGVAAISLYFERTEGASEGDIVIQVSRESDGYVVKEALLPFEQVAVGGWYTVFLGSPVDMAFGDANIHVRWRAVGDAIGPALMLTDLECSRFGDDQGRSLALKVFKGLADPLAPGESNGRLLKPRHWRDISLPTVLSNSTEVCFPAEQEPSHYETNSEILTHGAEEGWLQTHSVSGCISGAQVTGLLDKYSRTLVSQIGVAHSDASEHSFLMLVVSNNSALSDGQTFEEFCQQILAVGDLASSGSDEEYGVVWAKKTLKPGVASRIEINIQDIPSEDATVYFLTKSSSHSNYGWCRWKYLRVEDETFLDATKLAAVNAAQEAKPDISQQLVTFRFPELRGQTCYLGGNAGLSRQASIHGFSPFLISDDGGYMQIHPLLDTISGGQTANIIPVGSTAVSCQVETAHGNAPNFRYLLIATTKRGGVSSAEVRKFVESLPAPTASVERGSDTEIGIQWASHVVAPGKAHNIQINFASPTEAIGDLFFVTLPMEGAVSYGWCRWYSLHISTLMLSDLVAKEK